MQNTPAYKQQLLCDLNIYQPPTAHRAAVVNGTSGATKTDNDRNQEEDSLHSFSSTSSLSSSTSSSAGDLEANEHPNEAVKDLDAHPMESNDLQLVAGDGEMTLQTNQAPGSARSTETYFDRSSVTSVLSVGTTVDDDSSSRLHHSKLSLASSSTTTSSASSGATVGQRPRSPSHSSNAGLSAPKSPASVSLTDPTPSSPLKNAHPQLSRASGWLANAFASSFQNRPTRPNSTSGSGFGSLPRAVAPPKFHSLDSHIEQQRIGRHSLGSGGPGAPPCSPNIARQAASLDRGTSLGIGVGSQSVVTAIAATEMANLQRTNSAGSSPTLSRALSISSVFSRTGSLASSMQNLGSNLTTIAANSPTQASVVSSSSTTTSTTSSAGATGSCTPASAPVAIGIGHPLTQHNNAQLQPTLSTSVPQQPTVASNIVLSQGQAPYMQPNIAPASSAGNAGGSVAQATTAFLDRFAKEAKGLTREAIQATKHELNARRTSGGSVAANSDRFEFSSEQLNGLADKTSSMLSGLFSGKMVDKVKEKVQQQQAQFGGGFPGRKGLIERSQLIKHSGPESDSRYLESSSSGGRRRSSAGSGGGRRLSGAHDSRAQEAENQQFLKEVCQAVLNGDGIGWLKLGRLRKLMEDENYRNFVVCRVNGGRERRLSANDQLDDVAITKPVWKGMLKLLQALVHGLEQSRLNSGVGGMQSTLQVLEIAHTHYWARTDDTASSIAIAPESTGFNSTAGGRGGLGGGSELSSLMCGLAGEESLPGSSTMAGSRSLASTTTTSPFGSSECLSTATESGVGTSRASKTVSGLVPDVLSNAYQTILNQNDGRPAESGLPAMHDRIGSVDSECSDASSGTSGTTTTTNATNNCDASESGSMTLNPVYFGNKGSANTLSARSTCSDSEVDGMVINRSIDR